MFIPVLVTFSHTGLVNRMPTLIVSVLFFLGALQLFISGLILDNINKTTKQNFEMRLIDCELKEKQGE